MKKIIINKDYETFGFSVMFWKFQYFKQNKYILRVHFIFWSLSIRF
jgi:hypothetical protein